MAVRNSDRTEVILQPGGHVFGRYTLTAVVGEGGMGVVWRARDETLGDEVALKFLPDHVRRDPEAIRDLKRETKRCLSLTHENIVRVRTFEEDNLAAAIVMEFVPGRSLAAIKADRPGGCLDVTDLAPLVPQLCAALDYAHRQAKVVHRDLKPANILVTDSGVLKVADFGIARSLQDTQTRQTADMRGTSGTLGFMGPQQLDGKKDEPAHDLYALGATLYDLLAGKQPFYKGDIMGQIRSATPVSIEERRAELGNTGAPIPPEWERTVYACLAKRVEDRPRDAGEVAARLAIPAARAFGIDREVVPPESHAAGSALAALPKPQPTQSALHYPAPGEVWLEAPDSPPEPVSVIKYSANEDESPNLGIWVVAGFLLLALLGYVISLMSGSRSQPELALPEKSAKQAGAKDAFLPAIASTSVAAQPAKVERQAHKSEIPPSAPAHKTAQEGVKKEKLPTLELRRQPAEGVTLSSSQDVKSEVRDTLQLKGKEVIASSKADETPEPTFQVGPKYPPEMHKAGINGRVTVDFIVDSYGNVQNAHAIDSTRREFETAAVEAVSQWKFKPGRKDGRNVNARMQVPIVFSLNK